MQILSPKAFVVTSQEKNNPLNPHDRWDPAYLRATLTPNQTPRQAADAIAKWYNGRGIDYSWQRSVATPCCNAAGRTAALEILRSILQFPPSTTPATEDQTTRTTYLNLVLDGTYQQAIDKTNQDIEDLSKRQLKLKQLQTQTP